MTTDETWLDVLLVVEEGEFFSRSKSGTIWGTLYFQVGDNQFFPQKGWTDLVAGFVASWLAGLLRVTGGTRDKERVCFFDGPCRGYFPRTKGTLEPQFSTQGKIEIVQGGSG
jgi:hypothetical protein